MFEARIRREKKEKEEERIPKKVRRERDRLLSVGSIGDNPVEPLQPVSPLTSNIAPPRERNRLEELYSKWAKTIIEIGDKPEEVRQQAARAVEAVRNECPLTYPPENEILARLEETLIKIRESEPPKTRTYDSFVGTVINAAKIKSHGDVEPQ